MFILEKYDGDFDHDYDENKIYYSNVIYKDGFLETIQKALEEQNKKLNLFGKEKTPTEVIELVKKAQLTENPSISRCDFCDWIFDDGFLEIIIILENEQDSFKAHLNFTDETKPMFSLTF
jgi:hypothetical protein